MTIAARPFHVFLRPPRAAARCLAPAFLWFAAATASAQTPAAPTADLLAALDRGLRPNVLQPGQAPPRWSLAERMRHYHAPGVALVVLKNGEIVQSRGYGVREAGTQDKVDGDTLFSVGSTSKLVTATVTLRLAAQQRLDLDRDVNDYLKRWRVPATAQIAKPVVNLRMLMSHTSGLGAHGFADYAPDASLPTLAQVLDGQAPAQNKPVRLNNAPGLLSDYSGGGVTVEQMVIEDAIGQPLDTVARAQVFEPLGMRRSTFENPLSAAHGNIAKAHDENGKPVAQPRGWESFPESAASGLWTSANDLGAYIGGLIKSYQGRGDFLARPMAQRMMTEVAPSWFGLGPRLEGSGIDRRFHHGGTNDHYRAYVEGYLETGDGYVVLVNSANGGELTDEIRNAFSDALGLGANPAIRTVDPGLPPSPDYAGRYRLDPGTPLGLRRALTDSFDIDAFQVGIDGDTLEVRLPKSGKPMRLSALGPAQYVQSGSGNFFFEFQRDAWGKVGAVTVSMPPSKSHAYYVREAAADAAP